MTSIMKTMLRSNGDHGEVKNSEDSIEGNDYVYRGPY